MCDYSNLQLCFLLNTPTRATRRESQHNIHSIKDHTHTKIKNHNLCDSSNLQLCFLLNTPTKERLEDRASITSTV